MRIGGIGLGKPGLPMAQKVRLVRSDTTLWGTSPRTRDSVALFQFLVKISALMRISTLTSVTRLALSRRDTLCRRV
jgi:hypothetical protein